MRQTYFSKLSEMSDVEIIDSIDFGIVYKQKQFLLRT